MSKPSFIGVGVQKCASTWIHRILEDHPQVTVSNPKELDFFSYHYHFGFDWYESYFSGSLVVGENSPSYFCDPRVAERVYQYHPSMKVIVCLRDPIARIVSHHAHEVRLGHVDSRLTFTEALENNPMYIDQSRYAKYLDIWLSIFPENQVLVLLQEDIQKQPAMVASDVYQFLGVESDYQSAFLERKANLSQQAKLDFFESGLKKVAKFLRLLGLNSVVGNIKSMAWARALRQSNMQSIHQSLPSMTEDEVQRLDAIFRDDMRCLQKITHLDLDVWPTYQRCFEAANDK
ncbi:MAG: sulfotransferase domain-containing protein [Flavobacteriales bacterium]|nr:sulfotransferase domain-containing protein [Flavobacteriales bacterium]